jgi:hypothetical protein
MDSRKSANISHTIHIMNVPRQSSMYVHDVAAESAAYYTHHQDTSFSAKYLQEEYSRAKTISQMWIVKFRMCIAIYCPHSWQNSNGFSNKRL